LQITKRIAYLMFTSALIGTNALAQNWPDKPIKLVVPFAAGGGVDNITRIVAPHLAQRLKQVIIIENKPGGSANIGSDSVAKATPDGYTLLMGATHLAFNRAAMKNVPFDSVNDLIPVARTAKAPFILATSATLGPRNVAELVAYMKANPDKAAYGVVSAGAPANLLFVKNTATTPVQVLYKSGYAIIPDLISNRVTFVIQTASEILPQVNSGKLQALAVTGNERFKALPNVPTMGQAGVANLEFTGWWGIFAPAKTPAAIVNRLSDEIQAVMKMPEVITAVNNLGNEPAPLTASEFSNFFKNEINVYANMVREFKIVAD
jgi:tripartite-type tricarboxylate transporter receptor subunit TctC